jgi:hypothetical protein
MPADSAVETAASGKATSDCREEKDIPRPKQKRPVDPAVVAALAGKFTPNPHKSTSFPKPTHEVSMPRGPPPPPRAAFTVPEFCEAHRISQAKYYEMKKEGWGPVEMEVGRRRLISYEAASVWRREREVKTAAPSTAC